MPELGAAESLLCFCPGSDSAKMQTSWRVEVSLRFTGKLQHQKAGSADVFDFEMVQILSMARDNGDYLFADAAMPVCIGQYRDSSGLVRVWTKEEEAALEPRFYYLSRVDGVSRLPLVIQERFWPDSLPHLTMPRSVEASFISGGASYRNHIVAGDNQIAFSEALLFEKEPLVLKIDWQYRKEGKRGTEFHRIEGELRFIRIENSRYSSQNGGADAGLSES